MMLSCGQRQDARDARLIRSILTYQTSASTTMCSRQTVKRVSETHSGRPASTRIEFNRLPKAALALQIRSDKLLRALWIPTIRLLKRVLSYAERREFCDRAKKQKVAYGLRSTNALRTTDVKRPIFSLTTPAHAATKVTPGRIG